MIGQIDDLEPSVTELQTIVAGLMEAQKSTQDTIKGLINTLELIIERLPAK